MEDKPSATNFIEYQNGVYRRIITRIYIILIITIICFLVSVIDSIYVRNKTVEKIEEQYCESIYNGKD